ncbi:acyltransferase [Mucilaginibacter sp. HMF5004]|uniref:acyltransferase family protein n=1 Tax=Mucilaginibacter rivuli TaxID=2857527 RepID=UPI001C5F0CCD|nr:acyltransferase [Mucilaginibacter rivuli]MBW4889839.1 acyltransferase [Mucilaginibacter rivuli]
MEIQSIEQASYTSPATILSQKHYPSIDGLRAVSIVIVIVCHIFGSSLTQYFDGRIGVEIFFVISGFLITMLLLKEKTKYGTIALKKFYIRRVLRIIPVAMLFVVTLLILNQIFDLNITKRSFIMASLFLKNFQLKGDVQDWYFGHYWSLSVEEQFYLLFPVCLLLSLRKTTIGTIVIVIIAPIITYLGFVDIPFFNGHTAHLVLFIIINIIGKGIASILTGCLFSILLFKGYFEKLPSGKFVSLILFIVGLIIRSGSPIYVPYLSNAIFDFIIAYILVLNLNPTNYFARFLNLPFMIKLGVLSYSIYIWQQIFTHDQPWGRLFKYADSPFINIPVLFLVSYLSYNFYEKKFLTFKDKFKRV